MPRLSFLLILPCALLLAGFAPRATAADPPAKASVAPPAAAAPHRVAIQINEDDPKKWHAVLGNIRNIQAELGKGKVQIAVVAIGYGLGMLTAESLAANDVHDAMATGVEFVACGNSMKAQQIGKDDLIAGVRVAQAGYVELMQRQRQGWAYLRP
jgi:hypothetical protein